MKNYDDIYKGFIHHHKLFEIAQVIAKDKDEMLQASQFIVDKWTQMKGCRIHFGEVDLAKWNREEMDLEHFVLKCVSDNYDDDTRKRYEELDSDDWDDDDEDWNDDDDLDDDMDLDEDDFDDFDDDWDDDVDIDDDDLDDDQDEDEDKNEEKQTEHEDKQDKKQLAKNIDIKTAKQYRSILRRMANRLDAIDREVDALCDDMESQRGNWGYYPSIRSMHENLESLRGDFSQIAEDMREV